MIHVNNLTVTYANRPDFEFRIDNLLIEPSQCLVVCGRSGSGKTTFLRLLNGLVPEYYPAHIEGQLTIAGQTVGETNVESLSYAVGTVFQNPATQFFHRRVVDELVFPCENQGIDPDTMQARLVSVTELLELADLLDRDLLDLSGGQRQRIAVATALMQAPQILLLDEPTANLDAEGIEQVRAAIAQVKAQGLTILISEHRLHFLSDLADGYLYFDGGQLAATWSQAEFLALTDQERQDLGLRATSLAASRDRVRDLETAWHQDTPADGLALQALVLGYKGHALMAPESVVLPPGAVIGISGDNGVGKTTLLLTLAGLIPPVSGTFTWQGQAQSARERLAKTSLVMQETYLQFVTPSVRQEITLGTDRTDTGLIQQLGLTSVLDQHPLSLSGGQQQRVMMAHALMTDKTWYGFDEPTSGLDYSQMCEVSQALRDLAQGGHLVLVVSHDVEFLAQACDYVWRLTHD